MSYFPSINLQKVLGATLSVTNPVFVSPATGASFAVTNAGTFATQVTSVIPGAAATNLGKVDTLTWVTGDVGVGLMTVQVDAGTPLASNGKWSPLTSDNSGKLWIAGVKSDNNAFSFTGGGTSRSLVVAAVVDDVAPNAIAENSTGAMRMSTRRELYVQLRDAAGNERGLNIDAAGAIAVTVASVPSHAVTNAGTFAVQVTSNIPGTGNTNLGKAANAAFVAGDTGVSMLGVRNDSLAATINTLDQGYGYFAVNGNGAIYIVGATVAASSTYTSGSSRSMSPYVFDDVSPSAAVEGRFDNPRISSNRNVYMQLRDGAGNERGLGIDASGYIGAWQPYVPGTTNLASKTVTGSLDGTLNGVVALSTARGYGQVTIEADAIVGSGSGTGTIEATMDGVNYFTVQAAENQSTATVATFTIGGSQRRFTIMNCSNFTAIQVRLSTVGTFSGTVAVRIFADVSASRVGIAGIIPGSAAAQLGKAEDAGHVTGDVGILSLAVRNDTLTTPASADVDYSQISVNKHGVTHVAQAGSVIPTYAAAISEFALAATPTYIFSMFGSASKTIRITRVRVILIETTETIRNIKIEKLSTVLTGGTSAAMTAVPHDSGSSAATASPLNWTANKTGGGTLVGSLDEINITSTLASGTGSAAAKNTPAATVYNWWGDSVSSPIVLRGTGQGIAINLSGQALDAGRKASVYIEWVEDAT